MRLVSLFSGGKDSCLALYIMKKYYNHEISCLLSVKSENKDSYMFHVPNIDITKYQAESLEIPIEYCYTKGEKEKEVGDLKEKLKELKEKYGIEGVITGAVRSVYQNARIQKICKDLGLWCFSPLWLLDEIEILNLLEKEKFKVIISAVCAYPLDQSFLGKDLLKIKDKIMEYNKKYSISLVGEGGEFETTVLDMPLFKYEIFIKDFEIEYKNYRGFYYIKSIIKKYKG